MEVRSMCSRIGIRQSRGECEASARHSNKPKAPNSLGTSIRNRLRKRLVSGWNFETARCLEMHRIRNEEVRYT